MTQLTAKIQEQFQRVVSGEPVDSVSLTSFQALLLEVKASDLPTQTDAYAAFSLAKYLCTHLDGDHHKIKYKAWKVLGMMAEPELRHYAELVTLCCFEAVRGTVKYELEVSGVEITQEEIFNCHQKAFEAIAEKMQEHLKEVKGKMPFKLLEYSFSLGLYFYGYSLLRIAGVTQLYLDDLVQWSKDFDWHKQKANLRNPIGEILSEAFDMERRLNKLRAHHLVAPAFDRVGRDFIQRLARGEANDMPIEKHGKMFLEAAALFAKLTGESVERTQIDVGISHLYRQIDQIDKSKLIDVKPVERLIE